MERRLLAVLLREQEGSESGWGGELRRERSPFILTGFPPDRQGVGGCLSLKSQLFYSVKRCKLTSSRAVAVEHIKGTRHASQPFLPRRSLSPFILVLTLWTHSSHKKATPLLVLVHEKVWGFSEASGVEWRVGELLNFILRAHACPHTHFFASQTTMVNFNCQLVGI